MTDSEVTAEINAQKAAFDEYLALVQEVRDVHISCEAKRQTLNAEEVRRNNLCSKLASVMKKMGLGEGAVAPFVHRDCLFHITKELARK